MILRRTATRVQAPPRHPGRLAGGLAAVVLAAGLVTVTIPATAHSLESPSGLGTSNAAIPVLSWARVPGATSYDVEVSTTSTFSSTLAKATSVNEQYVPVVSVPAGEIWWRVRARAGSTPGDWTIATFARDAAEAPVMERPTPGTVYQPPQAPFFTWKPVPGAISYTVQTGRDPSFVDPAGIAENKQKATSAYLTSYPTAGDYYWRVRAELGTNLATRWSSAQPYGVAGLPAVVRTGPVDSFDAALRDVVLDWEPVPGAAAYDLQISTDDGFLTISHAANKITGTRYSAPGTLANVEYYWRVRAVDAGNTAAPWPATPWQFRRAWPDQPELVHPRGTLAGAVPFFYEWTAIERASKYSVHLYNSDGIQTCTASTVHTTLANTCVPTAAGDYSWKVRATDEGGSSPTSDLIGQVAGTFHYEPAPAVDPAPSGTLRVSDVHGQAASYTATAAYGMNRAPDACTSALPATCVDLRQTPVLSWDPVEGATSYRLTISRDRELTNVLAGFTVKEPLWTPSGTLPDSQAGSAYFWVVQPCAGPCAPIEYPNHSFAKKSVAPALLSPTEGLLVSDDVTLDWTSQLASLHAPDSQIGSSLRSAADWDARSYVVETSTSPTFSPLIESATTDESTFTSYANTYPEGPVYWRVRATDGSGNPTVWSAVGSFEKRSPVPQQVAPLVGAPIGQDLTLSWNALPFAASYEVEVYAGDTKVGGATGVKHTSWAPSDPFTASADPYTWRVRRVDAKSRKGDWSERRAFRFEGFPPALATPGEGALVPPSGALFTWLSDPRATSYRFERRKPGTADIAESVTTRATSWAPTTALAAGTAQWRVTALDTAGRSLGASAWRDVGVVAPPVGATPVAISGSGKVGTELRLSAPTFDPAVETTTYQWYRGTSLIRDEVEEIYTVTSSDLGKEISVRATGALQGYRNATSSSNTITGESGDALVATYAPTISGSGVPGQALTVTPGTWPGAPRLSYQWFRDVAPITGVTRSAYAGPLWAAHRWASRW